jgi:hypothetical protein
MPPGGTEVGMVDSDLIHLPLFMLKYQISESASWLSTVPAVPPKLSETRYGHQIQLSQGYFTNMMRWSWYGTQAALARGKGNSWAECPITFQVG